MAERYRYAAFISYSSKDAAFARRLHRSLETYAIPHSLGKFDLAGEGKANRIYPVFRDREELSAGQLGEQIEAKLRQSAALVVICSPNSAMSPWVEKEIEYFAGLGRHAKIFAIIAEGAPLWDEQGRDATHACFPAAFHGNALAGDKLEPLAADARKGRDGYRNAWLKVVAGIVGVSPGQLIDRDAKRQRQRLFANVAVWLVAAGAMLAAFQTQGQWRPFLDAYLNYRRFAHSSVELTSAPAGTVFQDCRAGSADCPRMVVISAGAFLMGSSPDDIEHEDDEAPVHEVEIAPFAASQTEITFADWRRCFDAGGCGNAMPDRNRWQGDNLPVINVSWFDAQQYVAWLSRETDQHYRLLSEAEWEYAARAQTDVHATPTRFSWGDDNPICVERAPNGASFEGCNPMMPRSVGSYRPNAFGLYDMSGNVWEWVQDCYQPHYQVGNVDGRAVERPGGGNCIMRVRRGGSWGYPMRHLRSAVRSLGTPDSRSPIDGFRIARSF